MGKYACEALFGEVEGRALHEMVERSINGPCPCLRGDPCPITPGQSEPRRLVLMRREGGALRRIA